MSFLILCFPTRGEKTMNANVCHIADRIIRVVIGLALLSLLLTDSTYKWWGLLGIIPLATVGFKFCPIWAMLGISTCTRKAEEKKE